MNLSVAVGKSDHVLGPEDAPVTLVEYGDYQCPFCADMQPMIKAIAKSMGSQMRLVFRHMPLLKMHPYAQHAAGIEARDGTTTCSCGMDVQHRHADRHTRDHRLIADMQTAGLAVYQADIGRSPAHVEADDAVEARQRCQLLRPNHTARRS